MSNEKREMFLWCERYRPSKIQECILPLRMKNYFQAMVDKKELQNMLLVGGAGAGKTTVSRAIADEMGVDFLQINASENGNIDMLRTTLRSFASTISFTGGIKVVLLDEADFLTAAAQAGLRGFLEEFSDNCRFILTANYGNKIIPALKSRCTVIDFSLSKTEKIEMIGAFDKRVKSILRDENVEFENKTLAQVIMKYFPDYRKTLNELQRHSQGNSLEASSVASMTEDSVLQLIGFLKDKDFGSMRKWVVTNLDNDFSMIQRALYDRMSNHVQPQSIGPLVILLAQYDYRQSFCIDKEINTVSMLTEIMVSVDFK